VGKDFYHFTPYNYGPFDKQVYLDADALAERGLVSIKTPSRWREFAASPEGLNAAAAIQQGAPVDAAIYLRRIVAWARDLTFQQLVRSIYARYPEFKANSVFQG